MLDAVSWRSVANQPKQHRQARMNVGDLVIYENEPDRIGIVMNQVGVVDRWVVLWPSGSLEAFWSIDLEVISESR